MKWMSWKFLLPKRIVNDERPRLIENLVKPLGKYLAEDSGSCGAYSLLSHDAPNRFQNADQLVRWLSHVDGGSVIVYLNPDHWDFFLQIDPTGVDEKRFLNDLSLPPRDVLGTITITTNAIGENAADQDKHHWEQSFMFLAEHVVKTSHPLWGIHLHEYDMEYVLSKDKHLLEYHQQLSQGQIPRLIGPMTYFSRELNRRSFVSKLSQLEVFKQISSEGGCFVRVKDEHDPECGWIPVLDAWISIGESLGIWKA